MMNSVTFVKPFEGTDEEKRAARATHNFCYSMDECARCYRCDSRDSIGAGSWPCCSENVIRTRRVWDNNDTLIYEEDFMERTGEVIARRDFNVVLGLA
jgi:hypothetical protein